MESPCAGGAASLRHLRRVRHPIGCCAPSHGEPGCWSDLCLRRGVHGQADDWREERADDGADEAVAEDIDFADRVEHAAYLLCLVAPAGATRKAESVLKDAAAACRVWLMWRRSVHPPCPRKMKRSSITPLGDEVVQAQPSEEFVRVKPPVPLTSELAGRVNLGVQKKKGTFMKLPQNLRTKMQIDRRG